MRVAFVGHMPRRSYSGGRLVALTLAESLASSGVTVTFFSDNFPRMAREFQEFSRVQYAAIDLDNLKASISNDFDWVVFVPNLGMLNRHLHWAEVASEKKYRVALLNFETPNWFNSMVPSFRDPKLWEGWKAIARISDAVISLSKEGTAWATQFYSELKSEKVGFFHCYPSINSHLADRVLSVPRKREKRKKILILSRQDSHKGLDLISGLASKELKGSVVEVYLGNGKMPLREHISLWTNFWRRGMRFRVRGAIVGEEKYARMCSASVLVFPTRFEGFGVPPLEAIYCGTSVVCSDLPVLREFGGGLFHFFENDDKKSLVVAVKEAMASGPGDLFGIREIASFERSGRDLLRIFSQMEG